MLAVGNKKKSEVYQRGLVACARCSAPIPIFRLNALAEEFSVHCNGCGQCSIYCKRMLCVEEVPERRCKLRRT